jgi:hypothetical protein
MPARAAKHRPHARAFKRRLACFRDRRIRPLCHPSEDDPAGKWTEKEGFEPSKEVAPLNALAGRCLQPLGHFSGRLLSQQGIP